MGLPALFTGDVPAGPLSSSKAHASVLLFTRRSSRSPIHLLPLRVIRFPQAIADPPLSLDFLRASRSSIDDPIIQNLNALSTPSRSPFDPSNTSTRQLSTPSHHRVSAPACTSFIQNVIFPAWHSRSQVLTFCASVATSPDPDDPNILNREVENKKDTEKVVDERLDPYSGRFFPQETRTEELARRVREEQIVEDIVRRRTWEVVRSRCEALSTGAVGDGWEEAVRRWEAKGK